MVAIDMQAMVGYAMLIAFAPLVVGFYWVIQYTAVSGFKKQGVPGLITLAICLIASMVCFTLFSARTYSAIQDGKIDCIDKNRGKIYDCKAVFSLAENPFEYWTTTVTTYFLAVGFLVLAIFCLHLLRRNFFKKS
jgi:hypothetical protein